MNEPTTGIGKYDQTQVANIVFNILKPTLLKKIRKTRSFNSSSFFEKQSDKNLDAIEEALNMPECQKIRNIIEFTNLRKDYSQPDQYSRLAYSLKYDLPN